MAAVVRAKRACSAHGISSRPAPLSRAAQSQSNGSSSAGGESLFSSWDLNAGAADGFVCELQLWQAGVVVGIWQAVEVMTEKAVVGHWLFQVCAAQAFQ